MQIQGDDDIRHQMRQNAPDWANMRSFLESEKRNSYPNENTSEICSLNMRTKHIDTKRSEPTDMRRGKWYS